jgi:hypothetical protein
MNLFKSFNSNLGQYMRKAARPLGSMESSNPRHWRGKRLHHHGGGGGVCWLFVLLWMDSWCHKLIICKKWYKNNLKMRLTALLFDSRRRAPHQDKMVRKTICLIYGVWFTSDYGSSLVTGSMLVFSQCYVSDHFLVLFYAPWASLISF